jgi:hypothetical protein
MQIGLRSTPPAHFARSVVQFRSPKLQLPGTPPSDAAFRPVTSQMNSAQGPHAGGSRPGELSGQFRQAILQPHSTKLSR